MRLGAFGLSGGVGRSVRSLSGSGRRVHGFADTFTDAAGSRRWPLRDVDHFGCLAFPQINHLAEGSRLDSRARLLGAGRAGAVCESCSMIRPSPRHLPTWRFPSSPTDESGDGSPSSTCRATRSTSDVPSPLSAEFGFASSATVPRVPPRRRRRRRRFPAGRSSSALAFRLLVERILRALPCICLRHPGSSPEAARAQGPRV
jgi:hypothetical protein